LDYGGRVGRNNSASRTFIKGGRYVYPAYSDEYTNIRRLLEKRLTTLLESKGIETT
jgi:hypothetical protein